MARLALAILVGVGVAGPASADGVADMFACKGMREPLAEAVAICTSALDSGDLTETEIGDTLLHRGTLRYRLGDLDGALDDLSVSIDFNPEAAVAYYYKGLAFEAQGEDKRADSQYKNAYFYDPDDPEIAAKMVERALLN